MLERKRVSMADVGTRLSHLMELQELWSTGLQILTTGTYHTDEEDNQAKELEIALRLLAFHMMNDYNATPYAQEINNLPKDPKEIKDEADGHNETRS